MNGIFKIRPGKLESTIEILQTESVTCHHCGWPGSRAEALPRRFPGDSRLRFLCPRCRWELQDEISRIEPLKLGLESEIHQTESRIGYHENGKTQTESATDDYDAKVALVQSEFRQLAAEWEPGDGQRFPWVFQALDALDRDLSTIPVDELERRLQALRKRLAYAKVRRGYKTTAEAPPVAAETTGTKPTNTHTHTKGENTMAILVDVPKEVLVSRGEHRAKIVAISDPQPSRFDNDKESIRITFEIADGKYAGARLSRFYNVSMGKQSALGQLYRRLLGDVKPGTQVDLENLVGQECAVVITHRDGDDGPYAVVQDVFALEEDPTL